MTTDIVERLRVNGENALRKHLSLGMHGLCTEAADEIERLRAALRDAKAWLEGEGLYDQADAIGIILGGAQ